MKYICTVCGQVIESDTMPEVCPVCGAKTFKVMDEENKAYADEHRIGVAKEIGRAHVRTPVTLGDLVCRLLL